MNKLLLIAALLFMVGCAHVETQVTTSNDITTSIVGATYEIIPLDEQRNAPEFRHYSGYVRHYLNNKKMIEHAPVIGLDHYRVCFEYSISSGERIRVSDPIIGQTGSLQTQYTGTFSTTASGDLTYRGYSTSTPTYGIVGYNNYTRIQYTRSLVLVMARAIPNSTEKPKIVYVSKLVSVGSGQLVEVMPALIKSMLEDFPDKDGTSRSTNIWFY